MSEYKKMAQNQSMKVIDFNNEYEILENCVMLLLFISDKLRGIYCSFTNYNNKRKTRWILLQFCI